MATQPDLQAWLLASALSMALGSVGCQYAAVNAVKASAPKKAQATERPTGFGLYGSRVETAMSLSEGAGNAASIIYATESQVTTALETANSAVVQAATAETKAKAAADAAADALTKAIDALNKATAVQDRAAVDLAKLVVAEANAAAAAADATLARARADMASNQAALALAKAQAAADSATQLLSKTQLALDKASVAGDNAATAAAVAAAADAKAAMAASQAALANAKANSSEVNAALASAMANSADVKASEALANVASTVSAVNIRAFGAKGDGSTDDTAAINAAANAAKSSQATLFIPPGSYFISSKVKIYTDVSCQGEIVGSNATAWDLISVLPIQAAQTIDPNTVSGFTKGSAQITGLTNLKGASLILTSNEPLIQRDSSAPSTYTKNETALIASDTGQISPALDTTFSDLTKLTIMVKPKERPIAIRGLKVRMIGDVASGSAQCLVVNRSDVSLHDCSFVNDSLTAQLREAVLVKDAVGVSFEDCHINGAGLSGLGYGINLANASIIAIDDCRVYSCSHSIAGRHAKGVRIRGGTMGSSIDCHWGNDFVVDGVTSTIAKVGGAHIYYAGSDLTVRNSTFAGATMVIGIRNDTPELSGRVMVDNCAIRTPESSIKVLAFTSANQGVGYGAGGTNYDPGRVAQNPALVTIRDCQFDLSAAARVELVGISGNRFYRQTPWGQISVANVRGLNGETIQALLANKNSTYQTNGITTVNISNINANSIGATALVNLRDLSTVSNLALGFEVNLDQCKNVGLRVDAGALVRGSCQNTDFTAASVFTRIGASNPAGFGAWWFNSCAFDGTAFAVDSPLCFSNCVFSGAITQASPYYVDINAQTKVSYSNLAKKGATGYPILDNKVDTFLYN